MTTETTSEADASDSTGEADEAEATADPPEYRVRLDRGACDGVFACLVRDDRFVEAADGLATVEGSGGRPGDVAVATFADGRLDDARSAARACPVDAIDVTEAADE